MSQAASPQPKRSQSKGLLSLLIGAVLMLGGLGSVALLRYGSALGIQRPSGNDAYVAVVIGLAVAWIGIRLIVKGHKLRSLDADTAMARSDKDPILYLRSFALDESDAKNQLPLWGGLSVPVNPWESSVAAGFSEAGPLVAIGRPGEKFATTGASRVYVSDDEWQDKVLELAEKAKLVVWVYGETEGLRWEIGKLTALLPPEKLIVALPIWQLPQKQRPAYWQQLVEQIGHSFPKPLPDDIGDSLFITFDKDWTAQAIKAKAPPWLLRVGLLGGWNRVVWGLRTLLDQRHIARYQPGTGAIAISLLGSLVWLTLFSVIGVLGYGLIQAFM